MNTSNSSRNRNSSDNTVYRFLSEQLPDFVHLLSLVRVKGNFQNTDFLGYFELFYFKTTAIFTTLNYNTTSLKVFIHNSKKDHPLLTFIGIQLDCFGCQYAKFEICLRFLPPSNNWILLCIWAIACFLETLLLFKVFLSKCSLSRFQILP